MPSKLPDSCGKRLDSDAGELVELVFADVTIDVLRQILDDDLAAELLAEEADVGADDRTEIEQHRLRRALRLATKRASAFVGCTGASDAPTSASGCSLRRRENRSESATDVVMQRSRVGTGDGAPTDPRSPLAAH